MKGESFYFFWDNFYAWECSSSFIIIWILVSGSLLNPLWFNSSPYYTPVGIKGHYDHSKVPSMEIFSASLFFLICYISADKTSHFPLAFIKLVLGVFFLSTFFFIISFMAPQLPSTPKFYHYWRFFSCVFFYYLLD